MKTITELLIDLTDRVDPIHRTAIAHLEGLEINVQVIDARQVWNRTQVLITPLNGKGQKWIDSDRLQRRPAQEGRKEKCTMNI